MSLLELTVKKDKECLWHELSEEVMSGMLEWREQHPKATLTEIEDELDERLSKMRARMVEDMAMSSEAANLTDGKVKCPECGSRIESRGTESRTLKTHHNREITLRRGYGKCSKCGAGFFPPG